MLTFLKTIGLSPSVINPPLSYLLPCPSQGS
jgi:hypothetical protein